MTLTCSKILKNPGHGTATLASSAGNRYVAHTNGYRFDDCVGGVCLGSRIVRFSRHVGSPNPESSIAVEFLPPQIFVPTARAVHVLSMIWAGWHRPLADAVNLAYERESSSQAPGQFLRPFFGFPTTYVYPARFRRSHRVCGKAIDSYYGLPFTTMQGIGHIFRRWTALRSYPEYMLGQAWLRNLVNMDPKERPPQLLRSLQPLSTLQSISHAS